MISARDARIKATTSEAAVDAFLERLGKKIEAYSDAGKTSITPAAHADLREFYIDDAYYSANDLTPFQHAAIKKLGDLGYQVKVEKNEQRDYQSNDDDATIFVNWIKVSW